MSFIFVPLISFKQLTDFMKLRVNTAHVETILFYSVNNNMMTEGISDV